MRPGLCIARRLGTRFSNRCYHEKIDMGIEENDKTTLEELRLQLQKEIKVAVSI